MIIEVLDAELAESEALSTALARIAQHQHVASAKVFVQPRVPLDAPEHKCPGWLEYIIRITYTNACCMTIGMIQRQLGRPYEFHS